MNKHFGSSLESLFDEAGEREEFEALVMKKMIVDEIRESMARHKITASTACDADANEPRCD